VLADPEQSTAFVFVEHSREGAALAECCGVLVVRLQRCAELRPRAGEQLGPPVDVALMDAASVAPAPSSAK